MTQAQQTTMGINFKLILIVLLQALHHLHRRLPTLLLLVELITFGLLMPGHKRPLAVTRRLFLSHQIQLAFPGFLYQDVLSLYLQVIIH